MKINDYIKELKKLGACGEALRAALEYETSEEAWADCKRGDWMLWLAGRKSGEPWNDGRKKLVLASCECARLVWDKMSQAGKDCIELFERWAKGEKIPVEKLTRSRNATYAAAQSETLAKCADIARKHYPDIDVLMGK